MKKILIFYGTYGGGHIAAAKSIKKYIDENYEDCETTSIDCIEYINKYVNKLSTKAYEGMAKKVPKLWKTLYKRSNKGTLSFVSHTANRVMAIKLKHVINKEKPDLIISTHPFSSQMCAYLKKHHKFKCPVATVMTDFHTHNQWLFLPDNIDYFFVSNEEMKKDMVNKNHIPPNKIHVTGIPISDRFNEKLEADGVYDELWLDKEKNTVLFFGGGEFGLGSKTTLRVLRTLIRLFKELQIVAISGKNKKMKKAFDELVEKTNTQDRVKVLEYTDKVPELMQISRAVFTKAGGLTISESLVSGLPIIIINPIPGQEEENAQFLVDSGCAIWLKKDDKFAHILKGLYRDPNKLNDMARISKELSKPNSTEDICKILLG